MYELPPLPPRKAPRPAYRKSEAVKELERLANIKARQDHPHVDPRYLCPRTYKDHNANSLTACIIAYVYLMGGMAERINTTGRYVDNSKTFTDVTGRIRTIGTGQWLPTSGVKGSADISATYHGMSLKIEVKHGSDRQSEAQKTYQQAVERAGAYYFIAKDFASFKKWIDEL